MFLDEQAVDEVLQQVLRNVERTLSEEGHRAVLGIVAGERTLAPGVRITGVTPDGPAHLAGLRSGDVILEVDGVVLDGRGDEDAMDLLLALLRDAAPGDSVAVRFARNHRSHYTDVELGDAANLPRPGRAEPPLLDRWADLELSPLTPTLGRYFGTAEGLLVLRTPVDAPVDLRDGDVILRVGQRVPASARHARRILASYGAGEALAVQVMREGSRMTLTSAVRGTVRDAGTGAAGAHADGAAPAARPRGQSAPPARPPLFTVEELDTACAMRRL